MTTNHYLTICQIVRHVHNLSTYTGTKSKFHDFLKKPIFSIYIIISTIWYKFDIRETLYKPNRQTFFTLKSKRLESYWIMDFLFHVWRQIDYKQNRSKRTQDDINNISIIQVTWIFRFSWRFWQTFGFPATLLEFLCVVVHVGILEPDFRNHHWFNASMTNMIGKKENIINVKNFVNTKSKLNA